MHEIEEIIRNAECFNKNKYKQKDIVEHVCYPIKIKSRAF